MKILFLHTRDLMEYLADLSGRLIIHVKTNSQNNGCHNRQHPHFRFFVQRIFRLAFEARAICIAGYRPLAHVTFDQFRHFITINNSLNTNTLPKGEVSPIKTHRDDWKKAPIEPQIRPLVDSLRRRGITTVASCAGHATRLSIPYVLFRCTETEAWEVQTILHTLCLSDRTHRYWTLGARFSPDGVLQYRLTASSLEDMDTGLRRLWHFWIRRHRIDHDLQALASALMPADAGEDLP